MCGSVKIVIGRMSSQTKSQTEVLKTKLLEIIQSCNIAQPA